VQHDISALEISACRIREKEKYAVRKIKISCSKARGIAFHRGMITLALILPDTVTLQAPATNVLVRQWENHRCYICLIMIEEMNACEPLNKVRSSTHCRSSINVPLINVCPPDTFLFCAWNIAQSNITNMPKIQRNSHLTTKVRKIVVRL